jgi:predicted transcriptional regulator
MEGNTKMGSFFTVSSAIFNMNISNHAKLLYCAIRKYSNSQNECYPSRTKISNNCGFSITAYKKAVKELIDNNLMTRQARVRTNNSQTTNLFTTPDIANEYVAVPDNIFEFGLTKMALLVFLCLLHFKGKANMCYPSQKMIADKCDMCLTYVKLAITELVEKNLISTENQKRDNNGNTTLIYMFTKTSEDGEVDITIKIDKFGISIFVKCSFIYEGFYQLGSFFIIRPPP